MKKQDYNVSITVDATAQEAFKSINSVAKWWTENLEGSSQKLNDEFTVRFGDVHVSTQKLVEVIPDKKVVWLVTDSQLNFVKDKDEWTDTTISFEISTHDNKTQINFTHVGLVPEIECYGGCSVAWGEYIKGSLFKLLTEGKGTPELRSDFTTTLLVDQTPEEAFNAINNVRGWWSEEIEGSTNKLNDEFTYQYEDVHRCQMKLIEIVPDKRVVWLVMDNYFNFTKDESEWTGTKISFEIAKKGKKTKIRFTHLGLVPAYECFEICSNAWSQYIRQSLLGLITTGKGMPNKFNKKVKA